MENTVILEGHYGSDKTHACSAWTSTSRNLTQEKIDRIPSLLEMLATEGHHTPFEKSFLHFIVVTDIATHIHLLKHRIGVSINGESARYKELREDRFLVPDDWAGVEATSASHEIRDTMGQTWDKILASYSDLGNELYHASLKDLKPAIGVKRAKESARFFKGYNSQIECDLSFNWRSFYHFLSLRKKKNAQKEVRLVATEMLRLVKELPGNPFEHTIAAFKL